MSSPELGFSLGERVTFRFGVFEGMEAVVSPPLPPDGVLCVSLTIFGRTVPLEADPYGVEGADLTPQQWAACRNTARLISVLVNQRGRQSALRKARLLACACLERVAEQIPEGPLRQAFVTASRHADSGNRPALRKAAKAIEASVSRRRNLLGPAGLPLAEGPAEHLALAVAGAVAPDQLVWNTAPRVVPLLPSGKGASTADLVHDVFGDPYQEPSVLNPAWLAWNGGLVTRMAREVYQTRSFGELPVLADALEEAGCDDLALLNHLRQGEFHVRGCWALDLILDRW